MAKDGPRVLLKRGVMVMRGLLLISLLGLCAMLRPPRDPICDRLVRVFALRGPVAAPLPRNSVGDEDAEPRARAYNPQ
jgi:hypothetical protein